MHARFRRGRWYALVAALIALAAWAIPAVGSPTKDVSVDPGAAASAPGFTDLDTLTYAQAKARLDELSTITLPVSVPGLELLDVDDVRLGSNDTGRSLSLSGSANLPALHGGNQRVDLLVTAIWSDDASTAPKLAIAAKTDDLALSEVNPLWNDAYGDVRFATARLAVSTADQNIDPTALPEAAREFYSEPVQLTGGVNFAGDLRLSGPLADAFGYAGYSGDVALEGTLSGSAAALFGRATESQLGDLNLKATLGRSPTAPAWIADRTSTYEFTLANRRPSLSVDEDLTVAVDGTTNRFRGHVAVSSTGEIDGEIGLVDTLDVPFGLDRVALSNVKLHLARGAEGTSGGLAFDVAVDGDPIHVTAGLEPGGANLAVEGDMTVPRLAALGGAILGTPVSAVPGADDIRVDGVSFSLAPGVFSVRANATIKQIQARALLTVRTAPGAPAKPLFALSVENARLSALLPDVGSTLGDIQLPAASLTATTLTALAPEDMTEQEQAFFGDGALTFAPGLHFEGRLPLDALGVRDLGFAAGSEAVLNGTLGRTTTLSGVNGSTATARNIELSATLPSVRSSRVIPRWVRPTGATTLRFRSTGGAVNASFATAADVTVGGSTFATTIEGRLARSGQRTSIGFTGTITDWRRPFGASWITSLDAATLKLDMGFGGGQPTSVDASVMASTRLANKRFDLTFGLSNDSSASASVTASLNDEVSLGEIARAFGDLSPAGAEIARNPQLDALRISEIRASMALGRTSAFELAATTRLEGAEAKLLVAVRPGAGFTVGVRARDVDFGDLVPEARRYHLTLPSAAMVLSSADARLRATELTEGEFDFYKSLYGCADDATRASCTRFTELQLTKSLKLMAAFEMGDDVEAMAAEIGIQTGGTALLEGTIPVFGGTDFAVRASLGNFRFDEQPDWFERGDVSLEIGTNGLRFVGGLKVKIERDGDRTCVDGEMRGETCYDLLDFSISARLAVTPVPSLTLTGALTTNQPWRHAFGQDWLEIRRVALQLGVTMGAGPEVTMGFQGDVRIGTKDVAAALKVGLAPLPVLPFVKVNLIGFSAASNEGLALSDLIWLNEQITGTRLATSELPDVSLRNLYLQYSQQTDRDLCLTQGLRFNADLYVGANLPPVEQGANDPNGCRTVNVDPGTRQACLDRKAQGCMASVYGRFDSGGVIAGAELNSFELGPIAFDDSSLAFALTPTQQQLRIRGGMRIATRDYEFAEGTADLDISRSGFKFAGDAALFGRSMHGYLKANAPLELRNPSFEIETWLRADGLAELDNQLGSRLATVQSRLSSIRPLLELINGTASVANLRAVPGVMSRAGVAAPYQVDRIIQALNTAQGRIDEFDGPQLNLDRALNGFRFDFGGVPGVYSPRVCLGLVVVDGECWWVPYVEKASWEPSHCLGEMANGRCWTVAPRTVVVDGICASLGIGGSDCSWSGLMNRYVAAPLREAARQATGVTLDLSQLATVISRMTASASRLVGVECAYFHADGRALARGQFNVTLATRLRLLGHEVNFGAAWNFAVTDGSPDRAVMQIIQSLLSAQPAACPAQPAGRDLSAPSREFTATVSPTSLDEGGVATARVTFNAMAMDYPAVRVTWGDGSWTTIPAGESRTVTATHSYENEGSRPVSVISGSITRNFTATVRNVAPAIGMLRATDLEAADERGVVTLRGEFTDPGTADRHTLVVDWGDGSQPGVYPLAAGAHEFAVSHRYDDEGVYPVAATVSDNGGGTSTRSVGAKIRNVAPFDIQVRPDGGNVDEGAMVDYAIRFTDPGIRDSHTVTVDWGDGSPIQTVPVVPGKRGVEVPHRYQDNGTQRIRVRVSDDDNGRSDGMQPIEVRNVAPRVTIAKAIAAGSVARVTGTVEDPSVADSHTVTIDWGAGEAPQTVELPAGRRTFEVERPYDKAGRYMITVDAVDDDGAHDTASATITV